MIGKQGAQAAVADIAIALGSIDNDLWARIETWDPSICRYLQEAMLVKDQLVAHSIKMYVCPIPADIPAKTFRSRLAAQVSKSEHPGARWGFLTTRFSFGIDGDLDFLLQAVRQIKMCNPEASSICHADLILDLYTSIESKCAATLLSRDAMAYAK